MALMSLGVTLANIILNYALVARMELGVAGSAFGTVLAQTLGLVLLVVLRQRRPDMLPLGSIWRSRWTASWQRIAALGAPLSLSFIGLAVSAACVVMALRFAASADYAKTIAAYGIATRIFGFAFLPNMAVGMAMQSIVGNNVGAGLYARSDAVLRIAASTALLYCIGVEGLLLSQGRLLGALFVSDAAVVQDVERILRIMGMLYVFSGPILVLGLYFQAVGQPARAAVLTVAKPVILVPSLVIIVTILLGGTEVWFAYPTADILVTVVAILVLMAALKERGNGGFGLVAKEVQ
jgi:Na+-driven multidrug efflux pump